MPTQDRVRSDQTMPTLCSGQPPHEGGEHRPVRPVHTRSRVGAAQHRDLVAQHEELDILGGGRATRQQDQPEHLPEDQVQQPQRHVGIMPNQRSSLVRDPAPVLAPHRPMASCTDLTLAPALPPGSAPIAGVSGWSAPRTRRRRVRVSSWRVRAVGSHHPTRAGPRRGLLVEVVA
jgi:hypothetical protein